MLNHSVLTTLALFESFPNQGKYIVGVHLSLAGSVLGVTPWPSVQSEGDDPGCSRLQHCSCPPYCIVPGQITLLQPLQSLIPARATKGAFTLHLIRDPSLAEALYCVIQFPAGAAG